MLAYADGKEVEVLVAGNGWFPCEGDAPYFDWSNNKYRIKPEPTYRPFKDAEECWQEMQKHQPFGWVKNKESGYQTISDLCDIEDEGFLNLIVCEEDISAEEMLQKFTFADGTPFGVKEESV